MCSPTNCSISSRSRVIDEDDGLSVLAISSEKKDGSPAGGLAERSGDQRVQLLGAAEHRSARMRPCVSEERRPQRRRWAAWAPKIRRGSPAGTPHSSTSDYG